MPMLAGAGEHHAAALAVVIGHLEELRYGDVELARDELGHVDAGRRLARLPSAHRLAGDVEPLRELLLGKTAFAAQLGEDIF